MRILLVYCFRGFDSVDLVARWKSVGFTEDVKFRDGFSPEFWGLLVLSKQLHSTPSF